jgi:hypothetical protein
MAPAAIELFDTLRGRLLRSLLWRQRLPAIGAAASLNAADTKLAYMEIVKQLSADLAAELTDARFVDNYLESRGVREQSPTAERIGVMEPRPRVQADQSQGRPARSILLK